MCRNGVNRGVFNMFTVNMLIGEYHARARVYVCVCVCVCVCVHMWQRKDSVERERVIKGRNRRDDDQS